MADYDNTNKGVLFKNDRKESDRHPDYRGNINIDGVEYWLSAWLNKSQKTGKTYMSLSVQPKDEDQHRQSQSGEEPQHAPQGGYAQDDDAPF